MENTDAVLSSAGDSSSASEQLAQLLGLHIPIPSYTPPDGPPEELEFKPSSKGSEEHTSELQSLTNLVCRLLLEKKKK